MTRSRALVLSAALLACVASAAPLVAGEAKSQDEKKSSSKAGLGDWTASHEKANASAKETGRVILADFTGSDWCGYCIKLKNEVFTTSDFKKLAGDNFVLLELDFPQRKAQPAEERKQNEALAKKFKVEGFPTVVFMTPEGKEIDRIVGYGGIESWMGRAKAVAAKNPPKAPATQPAKS